MKRKLKMTSRVVFICSWLAAFLVFHLKFSHQEVLVDELPQTYRFFSDSAFGGSSVCSHHQNGDTTVFEYVLAQKKNQYAFTNHVAILKEAIDVSGFDAFQYTLKGGHPDKLRLFLVMEIPEDSLIPTHTIEYLLKDYTTAFEIHTIALQDFKYHDYWMDTQNINEKELGPFNFAHMKALVFGSAVNAQIGRKEKIEFHSVKFIKTLIWPYYFFSGVLLLMLLYWWLKKREREKPRALTVKFKPVQNQDTNQFSSVMQFMTNHYMNPLISVSFVCDQLGISEATLNSEIKKASSLTFKLLLNQLRIEEAKRLLLHTDSKISLIAQIVGYENVTHFNRTFKKETQQSPSAYRTTAKPQ